MEERARPWEKVDADDGKHASSVIGVHSPQGKIERRFGGEGSSVRKGRRGFNANGRFGATSFDVFFSSFFVVPSEAFFFALERPSGPFWVQFGVILMSNSSLFLSKSFFEKHAFRVDETILFKVREGSISVLFCNNSGFPVFPICIHVNMPR